MKQSEEPVDSEYRKTSFNDIRRFDTVARQYKILYTGLTLATIGDRLWGRRYVHWQSFCRPAGALMKRMAALGLVRCQYMSSTKRTLWFATNKSVGRG
jgi:hypothetical protein